MEIKIISVHPKEVNVEWSIKFTATIDAVTITGTATNFNRSSKARKAYLKKGEFQKFGIALKFDQREMEINKHPKYSEIRAKLVLGIIEAANNAGYDSFALYAGLVPKSTTEGRTMSRQTALKAAVPKGIGS